MKCPHCNGTGAVAGSGRSMEALQYAASRISRMGYFPTSDPNAKADIMEELGVMANLDEQVLWFAQMFPLAYRNWPGLKEMRAFFCRGYRPSDGRWAESEVYGEAGIPRELLGTPPGKTNLLQPKQLALPPGREFDERGKMIADHSQSEASASDDLSNLVHDIAAATNFPKRRHPRTVAQIESDLYGKTAPLDGKKKSFEEQLSDLEDRTRSEV